MVRGKAFLAISFMTCLSLFSCASSGGGIVSVEDDVTADAISLEQAIEQSAAEVVEELAAGTRIVIVAFSSEHDNLSNYIMDELTGALVDGSLEVADRRNLAYVYRELNFLMSGDVSDETAVSIGKFLGARYVITGQFVKAGNRYRYRLSGINVETAIQESSTRLNVRNDRALQTLIADVRQTPVVTASADYGGNQSVPLWTAGAYIDRGILFASRREWDMAIENFTEAIKLDAHLTSAYILRGRAVYAGASYVTSTAEQFSSVTTTITTNKWNDTTQRQVLYDRAIADFTHAIRLDPNSAQAYRERGVAYSDKGDYERAIADLTQTIQLSPNYAAAYNNRGNTYRRKKDYDRAIADYDQAIIIDPNFARAYMNRGGAYGDKGDNNRAIGDITEAIRLAPHDATAYNNRGVIYLGMKDYDRAIVDFTQAIKLDPHHPHHYSNRALGYAGKGNYTGAIADYEAALQLDPNNTNIRKGLESVRQQRGR
jgi:tetratricopeptide (TPR) repeat protein